MTPRLDQSFPKAMADVRSLLRNERASRRITHPHATYSTNGTLACLVCHVQIKSESLWSSHLTSSHHATQLHRIRDGTLDQPPEASFPTNSSTGTRASKKRKAADGEDDERKRVKSANGLPQDFFDKDAEETGRKKSIEDEPIVQSEPIYVSRPLITGEQLQQDRDLPGPQTLPTGLPSDFFDSSTKDSPAPTALVNEDEWAAFERDVATPLPESSALNALQATPTITAAPLTAAEIAARSREEASTQAKEKREAELEGEKEDATRRLEEEFDEMEELEERVRRLREKREEIRRRRAEENVVMDGGGGSGRSKLPAKAGVNVTDGIGDDDEEDDDDDDDEWDGWGFR